jgi:TolB protein
VIFTISSDGSGLRELTRQRTPHDQVSALVASPDGRWLAYSGGLFGFNGDRAYDDLFVVSSSGGRPRRITHNYDDDWDPTWSADGKLLAFDRQADGYNWVFVARADGSRVKRLTPNFRWNPTWSPDGRIAYNTRAGDIWTMDADGKHKRLLAVARIFIGGYEGERPVAWSPDGRLIAYSTGAALWVMQADGSHRRKLYSAQGRQTHQDPVWSPDSRSIAFTQGDGHDSEIFVVGAAGGEAKNLTDNNDQDDSPSWSPNSAAIAYVCGDARGSDICVINSDGSGRRKLTDSPHWAESSPAWLPSARSRR